MDERGMTGFLSMRDIFSQPRLDFYSFNSGVLLFPCESTFGAFYQLFSLTLFRPPVPRRGAVVSEGATVASSFQGSEDVDKAWRMVMMPPKTRERSVSLNANVEWVHGAGTSIDEQDKKCFVFPQISSRIVFALDRIFALTTSRSLLSTPPQLSGRSMLL